MLTVAYGEGCMQEGVRVTVQTGEGLKALISFDLNNISSRSYSYYYILASSTSVQLQSGHARLLFFLVSCRSLSAGWLAI